MCHKQTLRCTLQRSLYRFNILKSEGAYVHFGGAKHLNHYNFLDVFFLKPK